MIGRGGPAAEVMFCALVIAFGGDPIAVAVFGTGQREVVLILLTSALRMGRLLAADRARAFRL
jgi:hypothetical protein